MKYPIFLIDNHYISKIYNLLFLLKNCSYNRNNKKIINQNNIEYLYYLLENKGLFENIKLKNANKNMNRKHKLSFLKLSKDKEVKIIIKHCVVKELVITEIINGEVYYSLTKKGNETMVELGDELYFSKDDIKILKKLSSYTITKLDELFRELY
ncbi:MAG: hypothetical protein ACRC5S_00270 [Cetobacterium sp.]